MTQKLRSYNYLFDKYWYRQREFQYIDAISNVEQQQFSNNLTETHLKDLVGDKPEIKLEGSGRGSADRAAEDAPNLQEES